MQEITIVTASSEKDIKKYYKPSMIFALCDHFKDAFSSLLIGKDLKTPCPYLSCQKVNDK